MAGATEFRVGLQLLNLSGTLTRRGEGRTLLGTGYRMSFSDFTFQATTGEYMEGLAVRQFN